MADYFVIYGRNTAELFESREKAEVRATELAYTYPGKEFSICKTISKVLCPIGTARVVPVS